MEKIILSDEEKEEILIGVMEGGKFDKYRFLQSFESSISKTYDIHIEGSNYMTFQEFQNDCCAEILNNLSKFEGNTYGQLYNYVNRIINNLAKDTQRRFINYRKRNIFGDNEEVVNCCKNLKNPYVGFEDRIIDKETAVQCLNMIIKNKMSKKQYESMMIYILVDNTHEYVLENNINPKNYNRNFERAMKRLEEIRKTKEFIEFNSF